MANAHIHTDTPIQTHANENLPPYEQKSRKNGGEREGAKNRERGERQRAKRRNIRVKEKM